MKTCPKCNSFTYDDDVEVCPDCSTKLIIIKASDVLGIDAIKDRYMMDFNG